MGELPEQRESNIKLMEQLQNQLQRNGESLRAAQDRKLFLQKQMTDMELAMNAPVSVAPRERRIDRRQASLSYLQKEMGSSLSASETAPVAVTGKKGYYETQRESLTRLLEQLRTRYTENHPDVIRVKKSLADLETKKDEPVAQKITVTKDGKDELRKCTTSRRTPATGS